MEPVDLSLGLEGTHVLVTGAAGHIGSVVAAAFLEAGCRVSALDISETGLKVLKNKVSIEWSRYPESSTFQAYVADIASEQSMNDAFNQIRRDAGYIHCCVALASLDLSVLEHHESLVHLPFDQWRRTIDVNINGTFLTAQLWLQQLMLHQMDSSYRMERNRSLILCGSESGSFGERSNADYATSKSAIQGGLLQSLRADIPRSVPGARVNAIAPGPVDTERFREECQQNSEQFWLDAQATTALRAPVPVAAVAKTILFLASDNWSSHTHGQMLSVDSGKQGKVMWSKEEFH